MKKKLFLAALAVTALAGCTDNEFVGNNSPDINPNETYAISFGSLSKGLTRADHVGADAADKLNNKFYVVSFKGDGSSMIQTFDNYLVEWTTNTAGTTQSNTSDWEYVGKTTPAWSGINGNTQTIKFWDYSASQYDFIAWSPGTAKAVTNTPNTGEVQITAPDAGSYAPTYTLTGSRDDLAKCYIADMVTHYKDDKNPAQPKFQDEVKLTFRNLASKVRVAIYETVPGYSVKDVKFYYNDTRTIAEGANASLFNLYTTGTADNDYFYKKGTYTVSFPTIGSNKLNESDYNNAHVAFVATEKAKNDNFGSLNLTGKDQKEADATNYIGRTLPTASYAGTESPDKYYKIMLPNEDGTILKLRVDYTLLAIDGSSEEIKIHGATAYVPQIYAQWKPNYAYTYIFKISDNTNGWTSTVDTDPAGLYPITFDAIVVDSEEHTQSTITTVATPSITTYQVGHDVTKDEYAATDGDIYVQIMQDGTLKKVNEDNNSNICSLWEVNYSGTNPPLTEALVMDALNIRESYDASSTTGRNGVKLTKVNDFEKNITTIPGADGNDITIDEGDAAKFTPAANKTYAVTYKAKFDNAETYIYTAETVSEAKSVEAGTWYSDPDGKNGVTSLEAGKTYYKKYTNRNIEWGVKVIKVQ